MEDNKKASVEERLHDMLDEFSTRINNVENELKIHESKEPSWADRIKAFAFPTLLSLNAVFFYALYNKIEKIDSIETKVNILMQLNKIGWNEPIDNVKTKIIYLDAKAESEITINKNKNKNEKLYS